MTRNWAQKITLMFAAGIMLSCEGCVENSEPKGEIVLSIIQNYSKKIWNTKGIGD